MSTLLGTLLYNAPWLIAWYRRRNGKPILGSLGLIFVMDFFCGWTIAGWFLALFMALNINVVAPVVMMLVKVLPGGGSGPGLPQNAPPGSGPSICGMCGGSGSMTCSSCGGRGSWYDQPTTATSSAQLHNCGACTSSGRIRCSYCGGAGKRLY